jgi:hypothetical protein
VLVLPVTIAVDAAQLIANGTGTRHEERPLSCTGLVPARMLNEFTYCPRLFFIEWVQGRFTDNLAPSRDVSTTASVDQPTGGAPAPLTTG